MLEHISNELFREKLCKEFIRVSKGYVILIFPRGKYFKLFEKLNSKLLKKNGRSFLNVSDHFLLKPVDMGRIKILFKDADVKYMTNLFLNSILIILWYVPVPFISWFIYFLTPLLAFVYKTGPCRDAVIIYSKH